MATLFFLAKPMAAGNAMDDGNWHRKDATQPGQDGARVRILGDCTCLYVYDVPSRVLAIQLSHVSTGFTLPHAGQGTSKHWAAFAFTVRLMIKVYF